jgi:hypothetical protein
VLLGWTSREPILGPHTHIVTRNGMFRPFALVDGRAAATWGFARGEVTVEPLGRIGRRTSTALELDAADVSRFLAAQPGQ